jgi:adenine-specific DNA methylase
MQDADTPTLRKARGAFFTPPEIAQFLAGWAIRSPSDSVLEPSCGEAGFLLAAGSRLRALGANQFLWSHQLHGIEIHRESAEAARTVLVGAGLDAEITVADFFADGPPRRYDAVVGNPPYVRYQQFSGLARAKSLEAALAQGVRLTGLASSWAAFVIHASTFLKPEGRLGLVLPAELLSVNYAAQVRRFLLRRFASVRLVMFENRVFPGVLEEVVLLLAEGSGGAKCLEVYQARDLACLANVAAATWTEHRPAEDEKWTPALISRTSLSQYRALSTGVGFSPLLEWGETYLGAVTGNNRYFSLSRAEVARLRLPEDDIVRISPPGSRHLRGLQFTHDAWESLAAEGGRCLLFYPRGERRAAAERYVLRGEKEHVNRAYKCAVRSPWWRVPLVSIPDLFLTYMNHDRPRLIANEAEIHILNSVYGVALRPGRRTQGRDLLPVACLNSVTLLGAEVVGRAYGGGLLKLEPKEADLLPVPSEELLMKTGDQLRHLRPQLSVALRNNHVAQAVEMVDRVMLTEALRVSSDDIASLRAARERLFERRRARGRRSRGED